MDNRNDDGSLAFLEIAPDEANKHFNCPETTQQQLINRSFWLCDFIKGVKTKHGDDRYIVLVKFNKEDRMADARKFFTNSREIKYILDQIEARNFSPSLLPRQNSTSCYYARSSANLEGAI